MAECNFTSLQSSVTSNHFNRALVPVTWPYFGSAFRFLPRELCFLQLCHSYTAPGVLGFSSLALPIWVPIYDPLGYVSVWSPQRAGGLSNPSSFQSSLLRIHLGQQIRRVFLRLLLRFTCNLCFNLLVSRQPYRNTCVLLKSATPKYNFF